MEMRRNRAQKNQTRTFPARRRLWSTRRGWQTTGMRLRNVFVFTFETYFTCSSSMVIIIPWPPYTSADAETDNLLLKGSHGGDLIEGEEQK